MSIVYNNNAHDLFAGRSPADHFTASVYSLGLRFSMLSEPLVAEGDPGPYSYMTLLPDVEVVRLRDDLTAYLTTKSL